MTRTTQKTATGARRAERGVALVELMLITVPLCALSIVLASAIASTSTAKNKSMWKASLQTQQATTGPCGGVPLSALPAPTAKYGDYIQGMTKSLPISVVGQDILLTNYQTKQVTEQPPKFYFESAANSMFPDRTRSAQNSATFLCNEPNNGDSRRGTHELIVTGIAEVESQRLY